MTDRESKVRPLTLPPTVRRWVQDTVQQLQPLAGTDRWRDAGCTMPPIFGMVVTPCWLNGHPTNPTLLLSLGYQLAHLISALADYEARGEPQALAAETVKAIVQMLFVANVMGWHLPGDASDDKVQAAQAAIVSDGERVLWRGFGDLDRLLTLEVKVPSPRHPAARAVRDQGIRPVPCTPDQQTMLCEILCDLVVQLLRAQVRRPAELQTWLDVACGVGPEAPLSWAEGVQA